MQKIRDLYNRYGLETNYHLTIEEDIGDTCVYTRTADLGSVEDRIKIIKLFLKELNHFRLNDWEQFFTIPAKLDSYSYVISSLFEGISIHLDIDENVPINFGFTVFYNKNILKFTSFSYYATHKRELIDEILETISPGWGIKKSFISEDSIFEEVASAVSNEVLERLDSKNLLEDLYKKLPELILSLKLKTKSY